MLGMVSLGLVNKFMRVMPGGELLELLVTNFCTRLKNFLSQSEAASCIYVIGYVIVSCQSEK
jgi:hypothetical protein